MIIIREPLTLVDLQTMAKSRFGNLVKAVVDLKRTIMALDAELHADEEAALIADGSNQADLWGINLYPDAESDNFIEFDSMINLRPSVGNVSRGVENADIRKQIVHIVDQLILRS